MSDATTQTLQALGTLYETAFGTERWPQALDAVAQLIGGNGALLFVGDSGPSELDVAAGSSRYHAEHLRQYRSALGNADEFRWMQVLDELPPRTLQTDLDVWPDRAAYEAMPSVQFMRRMNLYHRVGIRPCAHGGWKDALTVLFDDSRAGITPVEAKRLELLVPHIARAIEQQRPFKLLHQRYNAVLSVLNRLGIGVLILDEACTIVVANDEAQRILEDADGLRRSMAARLGTHDARDAVRLDAALQQAARAARLEQHPGRGSSLQVARRSQREPFMLEIAPFRDDGNEMGSAFVGVLVAIVDPDHRQLVAVDGLARNYGLTSAESQVCELITRGLTLREIADSRNVSFATVKTQSRSIYGKTQTRNRRELVQRAHSITPPIRDDAH